MNLDQHIVTNNKHLAEIVFSASLSPLNRIQEVAWTGMLRVPDVYSGLCEVHDCFTASAEDALS